MIGYLLAVAAQISYAVGAIILKKYLEKLPGLTLSLTSIGIAGFFSFGLLVLVTAGFLSLPALYLVKTNLKQIFSSENLLWVMVYALSIFCLFAFFFYFKRRNYSKNNFGRSFNVNWIFPGGYLASHPC